MPPTQDLYIGLDVSTSAAKAIVVDADANTIVARGQYLFQPLAVDASHPGRAEQDPAEWILGVQTATRLALQSVDASCVRGMAVSGQQHGLVALDEHKQVSTRTAQNCSTSLVQGVTGMALM